MKIYEIGTGYTPIPAQTGAATEIVVEELAKAFLKMEIPVEIIDIETQNRAEHNLPIIGVKIPSFFDQSDVKLGIVHKVKRVIYSIALARKLKSILRKISSKVVLHFHNQYNLFFFIKLTSRKLRQKALIAYTNHSGIWRLPWAKIENTIRKRYFQEAVCMKQADIVFALNEETINNAVNHLGVSKERFVKINNGVNVDTYYPLETFKKLAAKELFGLQGRKVVLQVGSIYENKGQHRSLELLAPLMKQNFNLVYVYAGGIVSEEYHERFKQTVVQLGLEEQVFYLGIIEPGHKLNQLYNAADVTICASEYESFGLVIIEALSSGTPVLIDASKPFFFGKGCIQYTKESFAMCIKENVYTEENLKTFSRFARENAVQNYSWEKIARDYLDALK